jgi:YesN/AraC family two-component response regulator
MGTRSEPMPTISLLLVEDEEVSMGLLASILARKFPDFPLYTARNGRAGLELFTARTPDIVITDINMPEMGGMQMADKIRAIKPGVKFIVITGDTGRLALEDSLGVGFKIDHYIVKPVIFEELFVAIEQCLAAIARQD